ncbi:hypothetical protein LOTGIDRAFT_176038 [Lottia gigantea]|uniref:Uncharacterized protein n=1 Tax=Lottia gigantea TaxID=225164 RepID=V3ZYP9_LOTGI|nr:hypothetical protein LOTGIDRAFT_176038 [Lottia gigantea]ESO86116.1 hypothetical protein LOTGIDRAFT_176038 [Lottia gigantea]
MVEEGIEEKRLKMDEAELIEVTGYIHNVSPVKISQKNNTYFSCLVQTEREVVDMVCLNADKFRFFKKAEREDTCVVVKNVRCQVENRKKKLFMNFMGSVTNCVERACFEKREQLKEDEEVIDISVEDLSTKPVDVCAYYSISGKIINVGKTMEVMLYGCKKNCQNVVLSDGRYKVNVSVYGDLIDQMEIGKNYRLKNVALRNVNNVKKITVRKQTCIEEIEYDLVGNLYDVGKNDNDETLMHMDIIGVKCDLKIKCPICANSYEHGMIKHAVTVRCVKCDMLTKTVKLNTAMTTRVDGTDENGKNHKLTIYDFVMNEMMKKMKKEQFMKDCKGLEEFLIQQSGKMNIVMDGSNVVIPVATVRLRYLVWFIGNTEDLRAVKVWRTFTLTEPKYSKLSGESVANFYFNRAKIL